MSNDVPTLSQRMRALAERGHPRAEDMIREADALEKVIEGGFNAPRLLGAWARARRLWCECTGEDLV